MTMRLWKMYAAVHGTLTMMVSKEFQTLVKISSGNSFAKCHSKLLNFYNRNFCCKLQNIAFAVSLVEVNNGWVVKLVFFSRVCCCYFRQRMTVHECIEHAWLAGDHTDLDKHRIPSSRYNKIRERVKQKYVGNFFPPHFYMVVLKFSC